MAIVQKHNKKTAILSIGQLNQRKEQKMKIINLVFSFMKHKQQSGKRVKWNDGRTKSSGKHKLAQFKK